MRPDPGAVRPPPPRGRLDASRAAAFAALALACIDREYPNKPGSVLEGDAALRPPRAATPAFFGCFDWHSAVHGHWALVRLLKRFPALPRRGEIRAALHRHLTPANIAAEVAHLSAERHRTFERPYGWGWLLRLAAELRTFEDGEAARWVAALAPLERLLAGRTIEYLERLGTPLREGTHANTAFSLVHMLDYARAAGDGDLAAAIVAHGRRFYLGDRACPTDYEPSGEDFLSPCLAEADLMRRVLPRAEFAAWLDRFLPPLDSPRFAPLAAPAEVRDRRDLRIGHLIGLGLHRAWALEGVASALPGADPRRASFERLARRHADSALAAMFDSGYGGEHWLASFAVYLLTGVGR